MNNLRQQLALKLYEQHNLKPPNKSIILHNSSLDSSKVKQQEIELWMNKGVALFMNRYRLTEKEAQNEMSWLYNQIVKD